jgi:putative transposase
VQADTVHLVPREGQRFYVYTILDVYSRWAWAQVVSRITTHASLRFLTLARSQAPFGFSALQTDHGSEFSTCFTERVGVAHRHSRIRRPNDNGHLELFNRTIQNECFGQVSITLAAYRRALPDYLDYYNTQRPHLGLNLKTPLEVMRRY